MHQIYVPRENVNDQSVVILKIYHHSGDAVGAGDIVVQIETSKTNIDIEAPCSGILKHSLSEGEEIEVGAKLFAIETKSNSANKIFEIAQEEVQESAGENIDKPFFSKKALKKLEELGIDTASFDSGLINLDKVNILAGFGSLKDPQRKDVTSILENTIPLAIDDSQVFIKKKFSKRKRVEIQNLSAFSCRSTTSTIGIDLSPTLNRIVKEKYFLFTNSISDLVVYEGAKLLPYFPTLNARFIDNEYYGQYKEINFGWSFDNGSNLKVLTINQTNSLALEQLQDKVIELLELYESESTISSNLITNSTVTFTDLSNFDNSLIIPLINGYQSLILGLIRKSPETFQIVASFDHRVTEGLEVNKFLVQLKERILSHFRSENITKYANCFACGKSISEEIGMGNRGLIQMTLPNGTTGNICRNCFEGW